MKISNNNRKFVDAVLGLANNTIKGTLILSKWFLYFFSISDLINNIRNVFLMNDQLPIFKKKIIRLPFVIAVMYAFGMTFMYSRIWYNLRIKLSKDLFYKYCFNKYNLAHYK